MRTKIRLRIQGLAFLLTLALLLGLAVAQYNKVFTDVARVTLETDTIGNQLREASDVKVRGVIVGDVRAVDATADGATVELAIKPEYLDRIPADVTARLLPKTLFGERFVALEIPESPSAETLADGAVIGQDRSENAIELQRVVDDLLPLLQAVEPENLAYTLGAVAEAVRGRGDRLGANLAAVGRYTGELNTVLPDLQADISGLADFADTYESAADDLLGVLDDLAVTSRTLVDQQEQLRRTFTVADRAGTVTAGFLETNERNLISLAESSLPVLGTFAEYSPVYPCLLNGLARSVPLYSEVLGGDGDPYLDLNLTVTLPPRNPYLPGDQPAYLDQSGPDCRGLSDIDGLIAAAAQGEFYCPNPPVDGVQSRDNPVTGNPVCLGGSGPDDIPAGAGEPNPKAGTSLPSGLAGSTAELDFVRNILAYQTGSDPSAVSDLGASQMAPLLRGTRVALR